MTPKEKAKELVQKFEATTHPISRIITDGKTCALLCVDEIIDLQLELAHDDNVKNIADFYKEVKVELHRL